MTSVIVVIFDIVPEQKCGRNAPVQGILKLLKAQKKKKQNKKTSPDNLKPILLRALREEIAPVLKVILECSVLTKR